MTHFYFVLFHITLLTTVYCSLTPEEGVCKSDKDCGSDECCVGVDRRRFVLSHPTSGICRQLRYQGFPCHVFAIRDPYNHDLHVNYCPCAEGLECRGTTIDKFNTSHIIHHDPQCLPKEK